MNNNEEIVYHGSPSRDIVNGKFRKGKSGYMGPGIYFSEDKEYAKGYGKKMGSGAIYKVEIDIKNPLILRSENPTKEMLRKIYGREGIYERRKMAQSWDTYIINSKDIRKMMEKGYDGVIWEYAGNREYVLYDNSQIRIIDKENIEEMKKGKRIHLTEGQIKEYLKYLILNESVYMNSINDKKKQVGLTYQKGNDRSYGSINYFDKLKTDKMDNGLGNDTYEVPLKGGIMSYNITSIQGEDIM